MKVSRDHIFPDFLGGTRTIQACATCNNKVFGARFESKAARQLLAFQLMLSSLGLSRIPLSEGTRWERAYEHEGELYDLEHRDGRPVLVLSKPRVTRDEQGQVISVRVRSMDEAKTQAKRIARRFSVKLDEVSRSIPFETRDFAFEFGPDFGRLVMKMCAALSTMLPSFNADDIQSAMAILRGDELHVDEAKRDFRPFSPIDSTLPLLSHAIYVERGPTGLHGLAVLFGAIRMYCRIASKTTSCEPGALLGILDISTGEERFSSIDPQGLTEAPSVLRTEDQDLGFKLWMSELQRQISEAGAKGWSVVGRMPWRPASFLWESSTSEMFSKQSWSGSTIVQGCRRSEPREN